MDHIDPSRKITMRKVRRGEEEARADVEFWMSLTGEQRVELLWEMVLDRLGHPGREAEGEAHDQPGLSRSIRRVRRT